MGLLPPELIEKVTDNLDWLMNLEEAKELRLKLMKEWMSFKEVEDSKFDGMQWNFCEQWWFL